MEQGIKPFNHSVSVRLLVAAMTSPLASTFGVWLVALFLESVYVLRGRIELSTNVFLPDCMEWDSFKCICKPLLSSSDKI
jgi:hypothetical protein